VASKKTTKQKAPKPAESRSDEDAETEESAEAESDDDLEGSAVVEAEAEVVDEAQLAKIGPKGDTGSRALTRADPLTLYMREVQRHPLLSPD